jgi:hypothetical protein
MNLRIITQHGMRAYYVPAAAGGLLVASAFLPWVFLDQTSLWGFPNLERTWILALGVLAIVLASLSIATRKNSRHPLLVVGLAALGLMVIAYKQMTASALNRWWEVSEADRIVHGITPGVPPTPAVGLGIYLGLAASVVLVLFGLTIVVKRVSSPYAQPEADDV